MPSIRRVAGDKVRALAVSVLSVAWIITGVNAVPWGARLGHNGVYVLMARTIGDVVKHSRRGVVFLDYDVGKFCSSTSRKSTVVLAGE